MESLTKFFPNFSASNNLIPRIFGSVAFVHVHSQNRGKLDPRALKCVFIGYSSTQKGYKCFHPPTRKFFVSVDVTFVETESYFSNSYLQGEKLSEDREKDLFLLSPPCQPESSAAKSSSPNIEIPTSGQPESSSSPNGEPSSGMKKGKEIQESIRPLQVYSRRQAPISQPTHVQSPVRATVQSFEVNPLLLRPLLNHPIQLNPPLK